MTFRVDCNKCHTEADRLVSHTAKNPDRAFWKCANGACKFFAWEDELKDSQKIFLEDADADDMLPEPAQRVLSSSSQPPASQKRQRSPDPPSYQELDYPSPATNSHPSQGSSHGTHQTKTPRLSNASDVHSQSGSQRALNADGYLTPPSTLSGYTQPPVSPKSPSREGRERARPAAPMSQTMIPENLQPSDMFFEEQIDGLKVAMKAAFQKSERRRIAAERGAESKMKRIKQLEAQVEVLEAKIKKIQNTSK